MICDRDSVSVSFLFQEKELKWLLEEQVHKDLSEIHSTVMVSLMWAADDAGQMNKTVFQRTC